MDSVRKDAFNERLHRQKRKDRIRREKNDTASTIVTYYTAPKESTPLVNELDAILDEDTTIAPNENHFSTSCFFVSNQGNLCQ